MARNFQLDIPAVNASIKIIKTAATNKLESIRNE
jgi:hypothetical protein